MSNAPDGGWGWFVVAAVTISNLSVLPIQQCFGLVFGHRFSELGITATQTAVILHLNATVMSSLGLVSGPMLKKFSFRTVAYFGTILIFVGIFSSAFANSLELVVFAYCGLIGIGQGLLYPSIGLALSTYFERKRKVAMSINVTLTGLGPIAMWPLIAVLLERYGTTWTILLLAAISLHSFVGASLLRPLSKKSNRERDEDDNEDRDENETLDGREARYRSDDDIETSKGTIRKGYKLAPTSPPTTRIERKEKKEEKPIATKDKNLPQRFISRIANSLDLNLLRDTNFLVIVIGMGISFVSELNFAMMTPFVLAELANLDSTKIATIMSIQATADISGRICVPIVAQKLGWSSKHLYAVSLLGSVVGRSALATWSDSSTIILAVSILLGVSKGTKAVFQALVIPDNVPLEKLASATGLLMVCNGILSIALGPLIGVVHDETNSYVAALHFTSCLSLFCVFLWIGRYLWTSASTIRSS